MSLTEATDFKGFKVTTPNTDSAFLTTALTAAGSYDGSHAWISQGWLIEQGKAHGAAWREGFDKMAAYAQSKGWIENGAIRAHVEKVGNHLRSFRGDAKRRTGNLDAIDSESNNLWISGSRAPLAPRNDGD